MFLYKVKDINNLKMAPGHVLVELIESKYKGNIVIPNIAKESNAATTLEKVVVVKSTAENINVGDVIIDYNISYGVMILGDRKFSLLRGHDVKIWVDADNFNMDAKDPFEAKSELIESASAISSSDLTKMSNAAGAGLKSKYLNNKM